LSTEPDINQKDPRWIGAWWIGFVICAVCTCVCAIPLALFPRRLGGTKSPPVRKQEENESMMSKLKGRLINPPNKKSFLLRHLIKLFNLLNISE
jgi:hypothetical protein